MDLFFTNTDLAVFKILRLLRILRPLRFISHNVNMKIIVNALIDSVSGIINVVIVILLVWVMFCILAINLLNGKLGYCDVENIYLYN